MTDIPEEKLIEMLEYNKLVPERDLQAAARGRARFLHEASELRAGVSPAMGKRLMAWSMFIRKDGFAMKAFLTLTLTVVLLAGAGMTVYAAQDELPNQPLYGVKTWSEDVGLAMAGTPLARMEQLMNLAQRRVDEMVRLAAQGNDIPTSVTKRLQLHIEAALQLAAGQNDEDMQASLLRIHERLQTQEQSLNQLQSRSQVDEPQIERARMTIREQIRVAEQGLTNPQQFRVMVQNQNRLIQTITPSPTLTDSLTPQATSSPIPPNGNGSAPSVTPGMGTPMPNGNDGNNPGATPGSGSGGSNGNGSGGGGSGGGNKP